MRYPSSKSRPLLTVIAIGLLASASVYAQTDRKVTQLAAGVYEIQHQRAGDGFASGNTTVIIGDRQVFVVDSCFLPSAARQDIAQIRRWTDKPVAFVLNTHFHNDHNLGNRAYMDASPLSQKSSRPSHCVRTVIAKHSLVALLETGLLRWALEKINESEQSLAALGFLWSGFVQQMSRKAGLFRVFQ